MKIKSLLIALIVSTALIFSGGCNNKQEAADANAVFETQCNLITDTLLSSSPLDLHFCLSDTLEYDKLSEEKLLGNIPVQPIGESEDFYAQALNIISETDPANLSEENTYKYNLIQTHLSNQISISRYDYKYEPLSAYSGEHIQLPLLLTEFPINDTNDIDIYFKLLEDFQRYFENIVAYETAKNNSGEFMAANNLSSVINFCTHFPTDNPSEHFLSVSFDKKINGLNIDDESKNNYITKHNNLLESEVFPAYEYLKNQLSAFTDSANFQNQGLCGSESGREYYSELVKIQTGDSRNLSEIGAELEQRLTLLNDNFKASLKNNPELVQTILSADFDSVLSDEEVLQKANEYLKYLCQFSKDNFRNETDIFSVEYIEPHLSSYFSSAFFLLPPVDDYSNPTIYLNPDTEFTSFDLFTTLAHEGFPGHLQQTISQKADLASRLFSCLGYCEGWATYCELYTYPAAVKYLNLGDEEQTENISSILKNYRELSLCVYALLDYNIHYNYWTLDDAATFLKDYGITDENSITQIYYYIVSEPANYMTYYLGYINVLSLKNDYIALGHTENEFHEAFLSCNEAPFDIVKDKLLN